MPENRAFVSSDMLFCQQCPPCIHAAFQDIDCNPLLVMCSSDDHRSLAAFDFGNWQPYMMEAVHLRPHLIHGNLRHRRCTELLTVLSGALDMYLLCGCTRRHVFRRRMEASDSVHLPPGTGHAFHALSALAVISIFIDDDPRMDREPVRLIHL